MIAARVLDLPDPVGPVTKQMPREVLAISLKIAGQCNSSSVNIDEGIVLNTAPAPQL